VDFWRLRSLEQSFDPAAEALRVHWFLDEQISADFGGVGTIRRVGAVAHHQHRRRAMQRRFANEFAQLVTGGFGKDEIDADHVRAARREMVDRGRRVARLDSVESHALQMRAERTAKPGMILDDQNRLATHFRPPRPEDGDRRFASNDRHRDRRRNGGEVERDVIVQRSSRWTSDGLSCARFDAHLRMHWPQRGAEKS
jgi:hypothetical protein